MIAQAADALEHAHALGIVHRDVKPANLMLDVQGKLWVTDFGLARLGTEPGVTMTGDLLGTLRYMSPEQALAKHGLVDHRADVYALGVTLYELLTLRPAVEGKDREEVLRNITFEEPRPLRQLDRGIPTDLETVALKAMAKDSAERYATAQELGDDLRRFLNSEPIRAKAPTLPQRMAKWSARHKPLVRAATALLLLTVLVLAVGNFLIWREKQAKDEALRKSSIYQQEVNTKIGLMTELRGRSEAKLELALRAMDHLLSEVEKEGPLAPALVEQSLRFYEQILPLDTNSPSLYWEVCWAYVHLGNLYALHDQFDKAAAAHSDACQHFTQFGRLDLTEEQAELLSPERPAVEEESRRAREHWQEAAPESQHHAPDYRVALVDYQGGFRRQVSAAGTPIPLSQRTVPTTGHEYHKQIEFLERLLADQPTLEHRRLVIDQYMRFGDSLWSGRWATGQRAEAQPPQEAKAVYQRALEYAEKWQSSIAIDSQAMGAFVVTLQALSDVFQRLSASREAARVELLIQGVRQLEAVYYEDSVLLAQARECARLVRQAGRDDEARGICHEALRELGGRTDRTADALSELGVTMRELGAPEDAERADRLALALSEQLDKEFPDPPVYRGNLVSRLNKLAWRLANSPSPQQRDPSRAILLAKKAVELAPGNGTFWNTLGVAHYRAGSIKAALPALDKSMQLRNGGDSSDFFFLAMAHWRLGEKKESKEWYEKAVAWMDKNRPQDEELKRFRAEAADLLGIKDGQPAGMGASPPKE